MAVPAIACVVLSIIFTYFGIHVLRREIIFVDLSLAQLAALGTTVAFVMDMEPDSVASLVLSLVFVLIGAAFFAFIRVLSPRVSQEAVIGIVYVVGASLAILVVDRSPHGAEHIKNALNGSILWLTGMDVLKLTLVTILVAGVHWVYRKKFFELSAIRHDNASSNRVLGDFIFYLTLGLVIVFSVKTAGVYLIFTFLIIPAVCGVLLADSLVMQFIFGATVGVVGSIAGLVLSFYYDLPTGAALVCFFGAIFLAFLVAGKILGERRSA